MACFPLITRHRSLPGNVRKLSREIIASHDGWVRTSLKLSRRKSKISQSNICLANAPIFCTSHSLTVPMSGMYGSCVTWQQGEC